MLTGQLLTRNRVFAQSVEVAENLFERLRGLLGRAEMLPESAMVIERCGSVHTIGMQFPLDLIFLDREWRVLSVKRAVRAGLPMVFGGVRARRVVESRAGSLDFTGVESGVQLEFVKT